MRGYYWSMIKGCKEIEGDMVLTLVRVVMSFLYKVVNAVRKILDSGTSILSYGHFCLVVKGSVCKINLY